MARTDQSGVASNAILGGSSPISLSNGQENLMARALKTTLCWSRLVTDPAGYMGIVLYPMTVLTTQRCSIMATSREL